MAHEKFECLLVRHVACLFLMGILSSIDIQLSFASSSSPVSFLEDTSSWQSIALGAGVATTAYLTSEMKSGPTIFAGVYTIGATIWLHHWSDNDQKLEELVVPMGLLGLAIANVALWRDEDQYSKNDLFVNNLAGLALLGAYAFWQEQRTDIPDSLKVNFQPYIHFQDSLHVGGIYRF